MLNWWGERSEERLVSEDLALSITFQKGDVVSGELLVASHCSALEGWGKPCSVAKASTNTGELSKAGEKQ